MVYFWHHFLDIRVMKKAISVIIVFVLIVSCSKKSVPNKSTNANPDKTAATEIPPTATTRVASVNAMVVIDANGRIITPLAKLPVEENLKPDYTKIARAFTPAQKANLNLRYKTLLPKVIYVPDIYAMKSLKGTYSIYKKKYWYWKQADGLFYLDETYYK